MSIGRRPVAELGEVAGLGSFCGMVRAEILEIPPISVAIGAQKQIILAALAEFCPLIQGSSSVGVTRKHRVLIRMASVQADSSPFGTSGVFLWRFHARAATVTLRMSSRAKSAA